MATLSQSDIAAKVAAHNQLIAQNGVTGSSPLAAVFTLSPGDVIPSTVTLAGINVPSGRFTYSGGLTGPFNANFGATGGALVSVVMDGVNLEGANLAGADLTGASLKGANLSAACLNGATLWRTDFTRANLNAVDMATAGVTGANFTQADLRNTVRNGLVGRVTL